MISISSTYKQADSTLIYASVSSAGKEKTGDTDLMSDVDDKKTASIIKNEESTIKTKRIEDKNDVSSLQTDKTKKTNDKGKSNSGIKELSPEEKKVVDEFKKRDQEVKSHEAAHLAAGGGLARGGAKFNYQTGPDGNQYAIGGEVQIDASAADTPEKTIAKMQQVKRAALAPAEPSGQDRSVAASASAIEAQARQELVKIQSQPTADSLTENKLSEQQIQKYYQGSSNYGYTPSIGKLKNITA